VKLVVGDIVKFGRVRFKVKELVVVEGNDSIAKDDHS